MCVVEGPSPNTPKTVISGSSGNPSLSNVPNFGPFSNANAKKSVSELLMLLITVIQL